MFPCRPLETHTLIWLLNVMVLSVSFRYRLESVHLHGVLMQSRMWHQRPSCLLLVRIGYEWGAPPSFAQLTNQNVRGEAHERGEEGHSCGNRCVCVRARVSEWDTERERKSQAFSCSELTAPLEQIFTQPDQLQSCDICINFSEKEEKIGKLTSILKSFSACPVCWNAWEIFIDCGLLVDIYCVYLYCVVQTACVYKYLNVYHYCSLKCVSCNCSVYCLFQGKFSIRDRLSSLQLKLRALITTEYIFSLKTWVKNIYIMMSFCPASKGWFRHLQLKCKLEDDIQKYVLNILFMQ